MSINVYKHFNVLINVCFNIGEIRSNRKMKKFSKGVGVFISYTWLFLYLLYDIYYLIFVNMSIEILNIICCLIFFLI